MINEKEFAALVDIKEIKHQQAIMIADENGQPQQQVIEVPETVVTCPSCGKIIYGFQQQVPEVIAGKILTDNQERMLELAQYCSGCGQKLRYNRDRFDPLELEKENSNESLGN